MAQAFQARKVSEDGTVDYTPSSAVAAGDIVLQGALLGIAIQPIAANALGILAVRGVYDMVKITGAIAAGVAVYWDVTGNPLGGVAASGAVTATATANQFIGYATKAAASGDEAVEVVMGHDKIVA